MMKFNAQHELASAGYRMPAEWEPHQATWLTYPHNTRCFRTALDRAREGFADMVAELSAVEEVHVNVNDEAARHELAEKIRVRKAAGNVFYHLVESDDAWCRDHGAIIVKNYETGERIATDWVFNAWGGKYSFEKDNRIAGEMGKALGFPVVSIPMVLEGGSIETNGQGVLLATEQCLLNTNRNPRMTRQQIESVLKSALGVTTVLWLRNGLAGDDTDGHVDDLARFIDSGTIVTIVENDPNDVNYAALKENLALLKSFEKPDGGKFRIVTLPTPEPRYFKGERLPASYANFYIANRIVLLPTFRCRQDQEAVAILKDLFPDRKIVPIDASDIIVGLGACHCLTQQIPV